MRTKPKEKIVLVGVIKSKRDLEMVIDERKYRIPVKYAPVKDFEYIAFYEPKVSGLIGKQIRYFAKVKKVEFARRDRILPCENHHQRAKDIYLLCSLDKVNKLKRPIINSAPRRVTFAFTTLSNLLKSRNLLQIYGVVPIVSEIAIAFIIARLSSSTQNPPNGNPTEDPVVIIPIGTTLKSLATTPGINKIADMINTPSPSVSTGHRIALAIVNLFRSPTNSGTASSPGLPVRDIITVGLFITTLGAYVTELFMRAHCNSENQ